MNNFIPTIRFTSEMEVNNTLPFLDVLVHHVNDNFRFSVHRKNKNTTILGCASSSC